MRTGTVGIDDDGDLVHVVGQLQAIQRFSAYWEYMLDRAFVISPASPGWGGSAVVNERGEVVGVVSLRLGEPPYTNLAIPIEKFVPGKDERSEEHTSELQSRLHLVCRLLLEKKKKKKCVIE